MVACLPQSIVSTPEFALRNENKLVFVLPTTADVLRILSETLHDSRYVVGGQEYGSYQTPAELLAGLKDSQHQPYVVVLTDQLVAQSDTPVLVKSESGNIYVSLLEFVLNVSYGYTVVVWTRQGFLKYPPGMLSIEASSKIILEHLESAEKLGEAWQMAGQQTFRCEDVRRFNAKRKLRLFKSSVINTYRHMPAAAGVKSLFARIKAMDQCIDDWSGAQ